MARKRRTRQHIIADISVNYVERLVLLCGFSAERVTHDYGIDLIVFTYNANNEIENGQIFIQLKATDVPKVLSSQQSLAFSIQRADLEHWLREPMPVILILYNAQIDIAYWLYVQEYFKHRSDFDLSQVGKSIRVHIDTRNVLSEQAIRTFAAYRDTIMRQILGGLDCG